MPRRAVFLDRDGTIVEETGYLSDPGQVRVLPRAADAIRRLNDAGFVVVVVSNQAGVARGYFDEDAVGAVHRKLAADLGLAGASIDRFYYCPHHPDAALPAYRLDCACRKPNPGMLARAADELSLDLTGSFMIGDKAIDVLAGLRAGCRSTLVLTGYGRGELGSSALHGQPHAVASDLAEAVERIMAPAVPPARIRVLHVITRLIVGGAQENTLLTVAHLDRTRYEVTLASGPTTGPEGSLEGRIPRDITFHRIPELVRHPHPFKDAAALARLYALMRRGRFDIVHTHTTKAGLVGRLAARLAGVPIVVHTPHGHAFHDYLSRAWSQALKLVERWTARWTHRIICLTEAERQDHLRFRIGPPEKFEVIHSGVDIARFSSAPDGVAQRRRELGLPNGPVVGCVARLAPVKGVQYLLEAAPRIRAAIPHCVVAFVGDGPLRPDLERRANALGLGDAVAFLGLRNDVPRLLPLLDVVVLPSLNEGMGRAAVEAMAAGRPVVGSRVSGIQDVIEDGITGVLIPPADPDALAEAVVRLLRDPDLSERLAANAKGRLHAYGIGAMIEKIDGLYVDLTRTSNRESGGWRRQTDQAPSNDTRGPFK